MIHAAISPITVDLGADETMVEVADDELLGESGLLHVRKMQDPALPSKAQVESHQLTHLPFRSWCDHCVRGRGREMNHQKAAVEERGPEFHLDFAFMGQEGEPGQTLTL